MDGATLNALEAQGIAFDAAIGPRLAYIEDHWRGDVRLAMDAQSTPVTTPNAGIPAYLSNLLDPDVVRVLTTPLRAAEIFGETKKGDWVTSTTQFPIIEATGETSSYGDYNNNGSSGANANWIPRQSYHFQTISHWGEQEIEKYGLAKIDYASEVNIASAETLSRFLNKTYFFGVAGLQNKGALNDPDLSAPLVPGTKAAGGLTWANGTADEIYKDILALFAKLQQQMVGNMPDDDAELTLAYSPAMSAHLKKLSPFNVSVKQMLTENFPNMTLKTAPEYGTAGGQLVQMILTKVDGRDTTYCAFTEKMRAHPVIPDLSSWKQKKSAGTWGAIIRYPIAIAQTLGV